MGNAKKGTQNTRHTGLLQSLWHRIAQTSNESRLPVLSLTHIGNELLTESHLAIQDEKKIIPLKAN